VERRTIPAQGRKFSKVSGRAKEEEIRALRTKRRRYNHVQKRRKTQVESEEAI